MGAGNVGLVYARWGNLPHAPFRLLAYMALRTLDSDEQPKFWGGRESLAVALGRIVPKPEDDAAKRERRAAFQAVKDAMVTLRKSGAVELAEEARPSRNAVYALNLHRRMGEAEPTPFQGDPKEPMVGAEPTPVVEGGPTPLGEAEPVIGVGSAPTQGVEGGVTINEGGGRADLRDARELSARAGARDERDLAVETKPRPAGPTCRCGVLLDPDGTCFICRR